MTESMKKCTMGDCHEESLCISLLQGKAFAELSGDGNPIHLDAEFAARTQFKRPVVHGFLGASVFSKVLGTTFPGHGTIYLGQELSFRKPMRYDETYVVRLEIVEVDEARHRARIKTSVCTQSGAPVITGEAYVLNSERL